MYENEEWAAFEEILPQQMEITQIIFLEVILFLPEPMKITSGPVSHVAVEVEQWFAMYVFKK